MMVLMFFLALTIVSCSQNNVATADAIAVSAFPTKMTYKVGESFDTKGMEVIAVMSDATIEKLVEGSGDGKYQIEGFDSSKIGMNEILIKSGKLSIHFTVTINDAKDQSKVIITYVNEDTIVASETVDKGATLTKKEMTAKDGYYFVGWFIEEQDYMWNFPLDKVDGDVVLKAKFVQLNDKHVIVDAYMNDNQKSEFSFKILQALKEANIADGTTVYFAPGVYWTDRYTYATGGESGQGGALNKYGLMTVQRGARLLYNPSGNYSDVAIKLWLSPEKSAGQGFGSATEQYMDIYIKYDPVTQNGYALRIQRVAVNRNGATVNSGGSSVRFTLVEYKDGIEHVLNFAGNDIMSSAFMPDTYIDLKIVNNVFSVDVTTTTQQSTTQQGFNLPHEIHLTHTLTESNSFGGFGFQHTGTVSWGNRLVLHEMEVNLTTK